MKRHAIFVDAGYIFAQGSFSLLGKNSPRSQLKLNESEIIRQICSLALQQSPGVELLRIYWYDGARSGPTVEHLALANMPNTKLRLGSIDSVGEQKEVDSLLITDVIDLAKNQSICNATVVSADADVRIAVQIAQNFGVRVHLIGLEPSGVSQSPALRQEADTVHEITRTDVARFLTFAPSKPNDGLDLLSLVAAEDASKGAKGKTARKIMEEAIQRTLASVDSDEMVRLRGAIKASSSVPAEYDGKLLGTCRTILGRDLTGDERRELRTFFRKQVIGSEVPPK